MLSKFSVNKILVGLTGIIVIGVIMSIFLNYLRNTSEGDLAFPAPNPTHKLIYSGAISYFAAEDGVRSFKENYQKLDNISLFWYSLKSDGSISRHDVISADLESTTLAFAKEKQKKVLVGIENNMEGEKVKLILDNESLRKAHISKILELIREKGYDGIVVDYEGLEQNQAEAFTQYIKELSTAVHKQGKIVSIAVEIETTGNVFHGMNVTELSKIVDRLELSLYEEYGEETGSGPIASIGWVNKILKNIIKQGVPPEKIIFGTAHSGHDWLKSGQFIKDTTAKEVLLILDKNKKALSFDDKQDSSFFEYIDDSGKDHIVWVEDVKGYQSKLELAKSYKVLGVFIWYLGGEDTKIWE